MTPRSALASTPKHDVTVGIASVRQHGHTVRHLALRGCVAAVAGGVMTAAYPLALHAILRRRAPVRTMLGEWAWTALANAARPLGFAALPGGSATGVRPVVVVHGYVMNRANFTLLAHRLAHRGHGPILGFEYWTLGRVGRAARELAAFVAEVRAATGATAVDVIGHSMGGVVGRYYVAFHGGDAHVANLVTIGSPLTGTGVSALAIGFASRELVAGSPLMTRLAAAPPPARMLALWSEADVFAPASRQLAPPGVTVQTYADLGHVAMLASSQVADDISGFLRAPR